MHGHQHLLHAQINMHRRQKDTIGLHVYAGIKPFVEPAGQKNNADNGPVDNDGHERSHKSCTTHNSLQGSVTADRG